MKLFQHIAVYLVAISYLMVSTGVGLQVHYCHGDVTSISYIGASPICACDSDESEMSCCSTEENFYQFQEESLIQIQETLKLELFPSIVEIAQDDRSRYNPESKFLLQEHLDINAPPIYLVKSAFIFYG